MRAGPAGCGEPDVGEAAVGVWTSQLVGVRAAVVDVDHAGLGDDRVAGEVGVPVLLYLVHPDGQGGQH